MYLFIYVYVVPGRNRLCQIKLVWSRFRYCKWNLACNCSPMWSRDIKRIEEGRNRILPLLRKMKEVCQCDVPFSIIMGKWKLPKMRGPKIQSQINYFIMAWIKHENRLPSMLDAYINPFQEPQPWYIFCQKLAEWHCNENLKLFLCHLGTLATLDCCACGYSWLVGPGVVFKEYVELAKHGCRTNMELTFSFKKNWWHAKIEVHHHEDVQFVLKTS